MDVPGHDREAGSGHVAKGDRWSVPVDPERVARTRLVPLVLATRTVK
jgi:hypothetical protein